MINGDLKAMVIIDRDFWSGPTDTRIDCIARYIARQSGFKTEAEREVFANQVISLTVLMCQKVAQESGSLVAARAIGSYMTRPYAKSRKEIHA